jgi:pSer/pThr/pTyr-binding forkhead associated (FHA) protein
VEASPLDGAPGRAVTLWGELTIGRRPPADVLLLDDAVSGRHARFARHNGEWVVEDLASTNGTYVNGRRLTQPVVLRPGDVVVTGGAAWRFEPGTRGVEGGAA